jgi:hypothetical protein
MQQGSRTGALPRRLATGVDPLIIDGRPLWCAFLDSSRIRHFRKVPGADITGFAARSEGGTGIAMSAVNEELLSPAGMAAAHAALTARYPWFLHIKPVRKFDSIKKEGLRPRSQGCPTTPSVAAAIGNVVSNVDDMIFLRPIGSDDSTPRRGEKLFAMAIPHDALPTIITIDWTFGGPWGLACIIKKDTPTLTNEETFCEVVRRRGSVAIYEAISADLLRVHTAGQPADDPSTWPRLVDTDFADVKVFD